MAAHRAKITSKGQLTVPKAVRMRLGVKAGDALEFVEEAGRYVIRKSVSKAPFDKYVGYLKHLRGKRPDDVVRKMRGHD